MTRFEALRCDCLSSSSLPFSCAGDDTAADSAEVPSDDQDGGDASVAYEEPEADPASLESLGIETLVTSDCMGPKEGFEVGRHRGHARVPRRQRLGE